MLRGGKGRIVFGLIFISFLTLVFLSHNSLAFFKSSSITGNSISISPKEIKNLDDSDQIRKFSYLKGYKNVMVDVSSSDDFNARNVPKTSGSNGNSFKLNNLELRTDYQQEDTGFFNANEKPVKQTYFVKNLLTGSRTVKLNIRYEIDASMVIWNETNYALSSDPIYFRAFEDQRRSLAEEGLSTLRGNIIYFGNNYYDFKDVLGFDYKVSAYVKEDRNYIELELNVPLSKLEELKIDPELGWTTHVISSSPDWVTGLYTIDVDSDGDLDVVSSSEEDKQIRWFENNGDSPPSWTERSVASLTLSPNKVVAGDLDGDNDTDIASVGYESVDSAQVRWYENNGSSLNWTTRTITSNPPYSPRALAIADLDQDGRLDLVVGEALGLGELYYYRNNGGTPPTWTRNTIASSIGSLYSAYTADLDGDNDTDVMVASQDNDKVEWYQNNGGNPITWTTRTINTTADNVRSVYSIDLDQDGDMDVLSASINDDKIAWYENNGSSPPGWTGRIINASADGATCVAAADFDKDGDIDVVSGSGNDFKISWYENNGSSMNWTRKTITSVGNGISALEAVDLDQDGAVDVVGARGGANKLEWYENNASGTITSMIALQVIDNTEFVKNRKTLVRVQLNSSSGSEVPINLTFDGQVKNSTIITFNSTETTKTIDFYFTPNVTGDNKEIKVSVFGSTKRKIVNVSTTRNLTLTFVSVDSPNNFDKSASDSISFIKKTYPLSDNGLIAKTNKTGLQSTFYERAPFGLGLPILMHRVYKSTLISGEFPERAVGILPTGWFEDNIFGEEETHGISNIINNGVLVEADVDDGGYLDHNSAHELGHTYGLCDEYDNETWREQNGGSDGSCPNGDLDNDEWLDSTCLSEGYGGCPAAFTFDVFKVDPSEPDLTNFMGNRYHTTLSWVSNDTYNHLVQEFKHATPISTNSRLVVSGVINGSSDNTRFESFYALGAGLAINRTEYSTGNYTLEVFNQSNYPVYNFSFDVSFTYFLTGGNTTEINETTFAFTIPYNQSFHSFILKKSGVLKDSRNVTVNVPTIDLFSSPSQIFSDQNISLNWTSSDIDGDSLTYAILVSPDNGTTYSAVAMDLNQTYYNLDSALLADGNTYKIKILVTDGVNTNWTISNSTFMVDNDLHITNFRTVYQNGTQRVFLVDINNTAGFAIEGLSWEFISGDGEDVTDSTIPFTLQPQESMSIYLYHNYSSSGNYTVSFKVESGDYSEENTLEEII